MRAAYPQNPTALLVSILARGAAALGMWLARRDRNATLAHRPGLCLGGLLAVLLAPRARRIRGPACMSGPLLV